MSEFWVSEGRHWCKYCKKWISSNKIQIRQHEAGEKHIEAEEKYVRELSFKVPPASIGNSSMSATLGESTSNAVDAGNLLERITRSQIALNVPQVGPEQQQVQDEDAYPAPAHEVFGKWVEVAATKEVHVTAYEVEDKKTESVLRVGAADDADEEEARARELDEKSRMLENDTANIGADAVFRKRGISKSRKRKKRVGK